MLNSTKLSWVTLLFLCYALVTQANFAAQNNEMTVPPALINATIDEIAEGLENGIFTTVQLVKAYLARIQEVSVLNAVTEINPDALTIAQQRDDERKAGKARNKPLHGIPMLLKNNIATKDAMNNTAGSFSLLGATIPRDATVAAKLRAAGVVLLGKTNLSQWANFRSTNSSNGWSAQGGQCRGAYTANQDPSGSSSGSAVAASIGLAMAALGTETSGSILSPAENAALVGIKPTVGLTSRTLVIPISQRQDTVGPMARTVKDAAYLLAAIAGSDPSDNYTSAIPFKQKLPDYVGACKHSGLKGLRVGIPRNSLFSDPTTDAAIAEFEKAINIIREAGATIIENANFTRILEFNNDNNSTNVLFADFVTNLPQYLSQLANNPQKVHNLPQVRQFTINDPREDYLDRDVGVWDLSLALGYDNTDPRFWTAYQASLALAGAGGLIAALDRDRLDLVILPTAFAPSIPAVLGTPVVTVPLGFQPATQQVFPNSPRGDLIIAAPNIPFGISFLGRAFSEVTLIGAAYAFEQRTHARNRIQPIIKPSTEIQDVM